MKIIPVDAIHWTGSQVDLEARVAALRAAQSTHHLTVGVPRPHDEAIVELLADLLNRGEITGFDTWEKRQADGAKAEADSIALAAAAPKNVRRMLEYQKQGVVGDAATLAVLTNDAAEIARLRALKNVIDASIP